MLAYNRSGLTFYHKGFDRFLKIVLKNDYQRFMALIHKTGQSFIGFLILFTTPKNNFVMWRLFVI